MTISIGDRLPEATLKTMTPDGPANIDLGDIVRGKRVVIFAVPGAFTPTCHLSHLPGFLEHLESIKALGVDEIAVISVNDHYVMGEWAKASRGEGKILFLADHDASFTRSVGMDVDLNAAGLGIRSKRYSMIVDDGVVRSLNVEQERGIAEISGAANIMAQLQTTSG
jgi:glutaredoxin/glutathione-dependent peroxiredoxin